MEEDIKILEEFLHYTNCEECKGVSTCDDCIIERTQVQAIENLIKGYRKLGVENAELNMELAYHSISKNKIREKIEKYDKQRIKMEKDDNGVGFTLGNDWSDLKAKIQVLQELLGEEVNGKM